MCVCGPKMCDRIWTIRQWIFFQIVCQIVDMATVLVAVVVVVVMHRQATIILGQAAVAVAITAVVMIKTDIIAKVDLMNDQKGQNDRNITTDQVAIDQVQVIPMVDMMMSVSVLGINPIGKIFQHTFFFVKIEQWEKCPAVFLFCWDFAFHADYLIRNGRDVSKWSCLLCVFVCRKSLCSDDTVPFIEMFVSVFVFVFVFEYVPYIGWAYLIRVLDFMNVYFVVEHIAFEKLWHL